MSAVDARIRESSFTVMCDVDNPLHGKYGAAYVYAPQKGATPDQVALLDEGLKHFGTLLRVKFGVDFVNTPGAGAAGGLGAGCMAFLGARLVSGSEAILNLCGFDAHIENADLVITGEGRLDDQSFSGKALSGILGRARSVSVYSVCGVCTCEEALLKEQGLRVFETSEGIAPEESMRDPEKYLRVAAGKAITLWEGQ
jgi:glycerate kinase